MLYSEFVSGTGCKDNAHNYKVYKDLEIMYMNSDMTKSEIYAYGKKLVDNSKSPAELETERQIRETIDGWKKEIAHYEREIEWYKGMEADGCQVFNNRALIKWNREQIRDLKSRVRLMKSAL